MSSQRTISVAIATGLSASQIVADLGLVPGLAPALAVLAAIAQLCENVRVNRHSIRQLYRRCCIMMEDLNSVTLQEHLLPEKIKAAVDEAYLIVFQIQQRLQAWYALGRLKSFMLQQEILEGVRDANAAINHFGETFNIMSHIEIHKWQTEFDRNQQLDHNELVEALSRLDFKQDVLHETQLGHGEMLTKIMAMMQGLMAEVEVGDYRHSGLANNLYQIHSESGMPLPDMELRHGEVRRVGQNAYGGSLGMDIWEGTFLNREKVACKMMRAARSTEKNRERFHREMVIWNAVWQKDRGKYVLPFYGFSQTDGPYPYIVSPWQRNGSSIEYVKTNPLTDRKKLVKGIVKGIEVLHIMEPPIVHGDIKGANVLISDNYTPLLADFGLSKVLEDVNGVPFTQSQGVSDSCRWYAPELLDSDGVLSTASDIYAFGMTALELLTGQRPFSHVRGNMEVVIRVSKGERPRRPDDADTTKRGLDDRFWKLLQQCWDTDPAHRPSIQVIKQELEVMWPDKPANPYFSLSLNS